MKRFIQDGKCLLGVVLPENAGKEALFARSPFVTSGNRVGTPAATSRGLKEPEMVKVAGWIARVLREGEAAVPSIREQVEKMMAGYPLYQ